MLRDDRGKGGRSWGAGWKEERGGAGGERDRVEERRENDKNGRTESGRSGF